MEIYDDGKVGELFNKFCDAFSGKHVMEGYNETKIREFIRNLSEEALLDRNNTSSIVATNRSESAKRNDGRNDKNSKISDR